LNQRFKERENMEFKIEQLVDSFTKRYIEDITNKTCNELFAIFDIVMEEYKKTDKCPICEENHGYQGQYLYNNTCVACDHGVFGVINNIISFCIKANYCPICGKKIS